MDRDLRHMTLRQFLSETGLGWGLAVTAFALVVVIIIGVWQ